jgi:hypothetical protein
VAFLFNALLIIQNPLGKLFIPWVCSSLIFFNIFEVTVLSIMLEGETTNMLITGTNGEFSVGNFVTDIGKLKIHSTLMDQFDTGEY